MFPKGCERRSGDECTQKAGCLVIQRKTEAALDLCISPADQIKLFFREMFSVNVMIESILIFPKKTRNQRFAKDLI